ncbi:hypothetical protein D3C71_1653500 [compost metagenome]
MEDPNALELQVQIDSLRLVVASLLATHPAIDAVAEDAAMRLGVWRDSHEQLPVTEQYLQLMQEETDRMIQVLANLCEQRREADAGTA